MEEEELEINEYETPLLGNIPIKWSKKWSGRRKGVQHIYKYTEDEKNYVIMLMENIN